MRSKSSSSMGINRWRSLSEENRCCHEQSLSIIRRHLWDWLPDCRSHRSKFRSRSGFYVPLSSWHQTRFEWSRRRWALFFTSTGIINSGDDKTYDSRTYRDWECGVINVAWNECATGFNSGNSWRNPFIFQPSFFYTEQNLAISILKLLEQPQSVDLPRVRNWIDRFTQSQKITLSPEQQQAVEMSATQRVMILTGGPGCENHHPYHRCAVESYG